MAGALQENLEPNGVLVAPRQQIPHDCADGSLVDLDINEPEDNGHPLHMPAHVAR